MKVGFIDPFLVSPAIHCFNEFVELIEVPVLYFMPSKNGVESLHLLRDQCDAYIIVGSASHVTEPLDWHRPLAEFLIGELKKQRPVLGCCFGHQLLCHAFGSEVDYFATADDKAVGVREIKITKTWEPFKEGEAFTFPVSHKQVVKKLGPQLKAIGHGFLNDIVVHETYPMLTTQAHPEASSYFARGDADILTQEALNLGRKDGKEFIQRFFKSYLS
jgi:GMP synthase-like glutamine amidotransferase